MITLHRAGLRGAARLRKNKKRMMLVSKRSYNSMARSISSLVSFLRSACLQNSSALLVKAIALSSKMLIRASTASFDTISAPAFFMSSLIGLHANVRFAMMVTFFFRVSTSIPFFHVRWKPGLSYPVGIGCPIQRSRAWNEWTGNTTPNWFINLAETTTMLFDKIRSRSMSKQMFRARNDSRNLRREQRWKAWLGSNSEHGTAKIAGLEMTNHARFSFI